MTREYLWSLVLATGGAALLASPVNPLSASMVAGTLLTGAAGNLLHKAFAGDEERVIGAIFRRNPGIDENYHILLALRQAHLKALEQVIGAFDSAWPSDSRSARRTEAERFSREAKRFLKAAGLGREAGAGAATELEHTLFSRLPDAFEAALAARGSQPPKSAVAEARKAKEEIEAAALGELLAETGTMEADLPPSFPNAFAGQPRDGWFDLFVRDGAARLKANPGFRSIWTAEQIVRIGHHVDRLGELLRSIKHDTETLMAFAEEERQKRGSPKDLCMKWPVASLSVRDWTSKARCTPCATPSRSMKRRSPEGRSRPMSATSSTRAIARAKEQVDRGQSALARATLRRAAEAMRREEEERRERYVAGATLLYNRERDIALASYDGDAAAERDCGAGRGRSWGERGGGRDVPQFGSEDALRVWKRSRQQRASRSLRLRCGAKCWRSASSDDERGAARTNLGIALWTLGERESGTARLEEAVAAYRAALEEWTRERVPLDWATTQNNLGNALQTLGERESGTARLEEAVAAYRAALEERTRERVPLDWAMTQNNLGNALQTLGERESGTARLEEAVAAYRAALEERTRERVPLDWAMTQNNLGNALQTLGERESGTARLEEAVAAYRAALEERTRERVPLDWAMTQNNLGTALWSARRAGERDGAARGGGRGLSRGAGGMDARAGSARLGDDAEQSRHCALRRSASGRAGRRGWRRRSRPIARRWRNGRASGCRSTGR